MGKRLSVPENARPSAEVCHPLHVSLILVVCMIIDYQVQYINIISQALHGVPRTHNAREVRQFEAVFWTRYNTVMIVMSLYSSF